MPSYLENLTTARDSAATALAEILAKPKPKYQIDGESVDWGDYVQMLSLSIDALNTKIQQAQPYSVATRLYT